jgi:DNA modification methylase
VTPFYADDWLSIYEGDCRDVMRALPADSVHMVMTSPPYYGLRDYGLAVWEGGDPDCDHRVGGKHQIQGSTSIRAGRSNVDEQRSDNLGAGGCPKCGAIRVEHTVWGGDREHEHAWGPLQPPRAGGRGNKPGEFSTSSLSNPSRQDKVPRATSAGQFCECGAWRGQLGLEPSPGLYVEHLVEVFREVRRVLHPEGTVWLNLGDSYAADRGGSEMPAETAAGGVGGKGDMAAYRGRARADVGPSPHRNAKSFGMKHKDLIGIPWAAAFALREDGWWLRRDVVWNKDNPMPESVEDRPTSSHEYIFMLTKREDYFYDRLAVLEPLVVPNAKGIPFGGVKKAGGQNRTYSGNAYDASALGGRNRRSVWTINTVPYPGAHYAVFPPKLVQTPIKASSSEHGACPECGAQWRRLIAPGLTPADLTRPQAVRASPLADHIRAIQSMDVRRGQERADTARQLERHAPVRGGEGRARRLHPRVPRCRGRDGRLASRLRPRLGRQPDDLDIIASPLRIDPDRPETNGGTPYRRGLGRERAEGEGRRFISRFEQRSYAAQMRKWSPDQRAQAHDEIALWLGKDDELAAWQASSAVGKHPGTDAFRHYHRIDPRGARAIPQPLFDSWVERGWLTPVEPPDCSAALQPVRAVVMDIFGGSGTVGAVAQALGRRAILMDVNAGYLKQQLERAAREFGVGGKTLTDDGTAQTPQDGLWATATP